MTFIGEAWRGIQRFVNEARIDADFPRYEGERRAIHESAASRRFDTLPLEREIAEIRLAAEAEGRSVFDPQIREVKSSIDAIQPAIKELRAQLELLSRDYRRELDALYEDKARSLKAKQELGEQMKVLQKERSEAHKKLDDAHGDLRKAKESIASWYAKSDRTPWLLGNGGKKLPSRSLFGQSFGDLEGYKADRARASNDIGVCKAAIGRVAERQGANKSLQDENEKNLTRVFESIRAVKEARQGMFDLKDQGVRRHRVESDLSDLLQQESSLKNDLNRLTNSMAELVKVQACRLGVEERERAVAELREKCSLFLAAFDAPEQRAARQQAHREWWLNRQAAA